MIPTITWHLPRPPKSKYKGGFPLHFEQNLVQLLGYPDEILHPFGGRAELGLRCDLNPTLEPHVIADAHELPFADATFDCVILDPPYSDEEARELYETPKLRPATYTREAVRVTKPGGWVVIYTDREPARPKQCNPTMRIVVILRPYHRPRVAVVFQKRKPGMPFYGTECEQLGTAAAVMQVVDEGAAEVVQPLRQTVEADLVAPAVQHLDQERLVVDAQRNGTARPDRGERLGDTGAALEVTDAVEERDAGVPGDDDLAAAVADGDAVVAAFHRGEPTAGRVA